MKQNAAPYIDREGELLDLHLSLGREDGREDDKAVQETETKLWLGNSPISSLLGLVTYNEYQFHSE